MQKYLKNKILLFVAFAILGLGIVYQNCGKTTSDQSTNNNSTMKNALLTASQPAQSRLKLTLQDGTKVVLVPAGKDKTLVLALKDGTKVKLQAR